MLKDINVRFFALLEDEPAIDQLPEDLNITASAIDQEINNA
jgi:hypothetical protein